MAFTGTTKITRDDLAQAWQDILKKQEPGHDKPSIERFAKELDSNLDTLAGELQAGTYQPEDLWAMIISIGDKERELHIPAVADRVVERALLKKLTPHVEPHLGPSSFAYRPGLGVGDAVREVVALREEGLHWAVRADIDDCFPSIDPQRCLRMLAAVVPDADLVALTELLLGRRARGKHFRGTRAVPGLAQGCALSPLLSNLLLSEVDAELMQAGVPTVRYADDMVCLASNETEALEAARTLHAAVEEVDLRLGADKFEVMSFNDGFCFVGEDFGPRYPPAETDEAGRETPERLVVYVGRQGSWIKTARGRLIVESKDDVVQLDIAQRKVERIVVFGAVGLSSGVTGWALANSVEIVYASRRGNYQGCLRGPLGKLKTERLAAQLRFRDSPGALELARKLIDAKIAKQAVLLQRSNRRETATDVREALGQVQAARSYLMAAQSREEIMGIEGAAAKAYFTGFSRLLPEQVRFTSRTRRPPLDVINAALSFGYTILFAECETALRAGGYEASIGVLHLDHGTREDLALDLMEEFRPWVVDQVVMQLARAGSLRPDSGRSDNARPGVLLTQAAKGALLDAYERRMLQHVGGALPDYAGTIRRHLYRQAQRLGQAILAGDEWTGAAWR